MNPKTEARVLNDYLKLIDSQDANEKYYRRIAQSFFIVSILVLFYLFSDGPQNNASNTMFIISAFLSGICSGIGIWMSQMSSQTKLLVRHLSKSSINDRINELRKDVDL